MREEMQKKKESELDTNNSISENSCNIKEDDANSNVISVNKNGMYKLCIIIIIS